MSTLFRPSGPLPPSVYWFRRGLVLVVVLLLLLGARSVLSRAKPSAAQTPPPSTPTTPTTPAAATSAPATSAPATSAPATSPTPTRSVSSPAAPTTRATSSVPACTSRQITVTASTDAASYPVGSTPRLRMRIQNTSSTSCSRDIGAAQNTLLITSGGAHVWSSDDCNPGGSPQVVTMTPGQSYSVAVTWLGHLSQKGCPTNQPLAAKGTYKLTGRNGTVVSVPVIFALT